MNLIADSMAWPEAAFGIAAVIALAIVIWIVFKYGS